MHCRRCWCPLRVSVCVCVSRAFLMADCEMLVLSAVVSVARSAPSLPLPSTCNVRGDEFKFARRMEWKGEPAWHEGWTRIQLIREILRERGGLRVASTRVETVSASICLISCECGSRVSSVAWITRSSLSFILSLSPSDRLALPHVISLDVDQTVVGII